MLILIVLFVWIVPADVLIAREILCAILALVSITLIAILAFALAVIRSA